MQTSKRLLLRLALVLLVVVLVASIAPLARQQKAQASQQETNSVGIVCTTDASPNPTFNLSTRTGHISLSDGNTMFMWGYSEEGKAFQHPGPVLCVKEGDHVTVVLNNSALNVPTSIMFPAIENVLVNGLPAQPDLVNNSLTNVALPGSSVTYTFVASRPGTYIYESGTDSRLQVNMGLFGVLIVRPATVPAGGTSLDPKQYAYDRAESEFTQGEEFLTLLSEIDPYLHQAIENGQAYDMNNYKVRYWLINGRGFPDTIADNFATWLPSQPYGALARIHPYDATAHPRPGLERFVNVGTEDFPFHPHANNGSIIGRDGHPLVNGTADTSFEKFSINIGPGQTWDVLFQWSDDNNYSESNPVTVTLPDLADITIGMFYSGSPYLGSMGIMPPGTNTLNQCGEYYIISHNHALFQINAWDATMGGQITYLRVDPPLAEQALPGHISCP